MSRFSALGDMLTSVFDRGVRLATWSSDGADAVAPIRQLMDDLMSSRGEASGIAIATEVLGRYAALDADQRLEFFQHVATAFNPDPDTVRDAALAYAVDTSPATLKTLFQAAEPPRQELFRRLNQAPGGTQQLVQMRAHLLALLRAHPDLKGIDQDFQHLLGSWFNRGFLVMRPIDWQTPAAVLEKIIAYEAVHQIDSWDELRRRVDPSDRRCFAFFHPSMPDEPLIFVEVALTKEIPGSIQAVLDPKRLLIAAEDATTAVFYSISNCQAGLAGVSFGAFLIKQVATDLTRTLPGLETFVTLSPVPGLVRWLKTQAEAEPDSDAPLALGLLDREASEPADDQTRTRLLGLAARYFLEAKRPDGRPPDPVARFHLGNGAELAAIHWMGDTSDKGMAQSLGIMVNYLYRLDRIETNHEAYAADATITAARAVRSLLRG